MESSSEIGALALALATAQGEIRSALKDSVNPHLKSKYADLANVWDAIRAPLSKNKLAVVQMVSAEGDAVSVTSTLCHESGQWMRGTLTLKAPKSDPQGVGSAITYARRYALSALVGVAQDDDDGHAASNGNGNGKAAQAPPNAAFEEFFAKAKAVFAGDKEGMASFLNERKLTMAALQSASPARLASLAKELPKQEEAVA